MSPRALRVLLAEPGSGRGPSARQVLGTWTWSSETQLWLRPVMLLRCAGRESGVFCVPGRRARRGRCFKVSYLFGFFSGEGSSLYFPQYFLTHFHLHCPACFFVCFFFILARGKIFKVSGFVFKDTDLSVILCIFSDVNIFWHSR